MDANVKSVHAEFFMLGVIFSYVELAITPSGVFGNSIPGSFMLFTNYTLFKRQYYIIQLIILLTSYQ